ncbi:Flap endonuclease 1 [Bienertia sinuspersici]
MDSTTHPPTTNMSQPPLGGDNQNPPMSLVPDTPGVTATPDPEFIHLITQSCLVGKAFGDPPLKYVIKGRLTRQWKYLKGEVTFVPMGNCWFLIEFANKEDRDYVWENRPWFVQVADPVPGFIFVNLGSIIKKLHLNYEGMLEVCPLCGNPTHPLESCPNKVVSSMQLIVEQHSLQPSSASSPIQGPTNWVKIVPKKKTTAPPSKATQPPTHFSPNTSSSSSHHSHFLLPIHEPTHNQFDPLLSDENLPLAMRSPSPATPPVFEYGSNLNESEDNQFYEAMGIDIPSTSESSKRKRTSLDDDKKE